MPLMNCEKITPLFPLAPRRAPFAKDSIKEPTVSCGKEVATESLAACNVSNILIPVSPSGTGNTFNEFIASTLASMNFVPDRNSCFNPSAFNEATC